MAACQEVLWIALLNSIIHLLFIYLLVIGIDFEGYVRELYLVRGTA